MNCQVRSLLISFLLHSGLILFAITLTSSFAQLSRPVVVDFSIMASATPDPQPEKTTKNTRQEIQTPKQRVDREKISEKPERAKVQAVAPTSPLPATEAAGPVSVSAPIRQTTSVARPEAGKGGASSEQGRVTSGGGTAGAVEQMKSRYLRQHFDYIKELVQKNITYPAKARRMGLTGRVVVSFTVLENGHVANVRILDSSGHDLLDNNVLETVKAVEPFPKPPVSAELRIPIFYRIN